MRDLCDDFTFWSMLFSVFLFGVAVGAMIVGGAPV